MLSTNYKDPVKSLVEPIQSNPSKNPNYIVVPPQCYPLFCDVNDKEISERLSAP